MKIRIARDARPGCARWIASAAAAAAFAMMPALTRAASTVSWINSAGAAWNGFNWTGGVNNNPPTASDTAAFNIFGAYNVNFVASTGVAGVQVGGSNVTFLNLFAGVTFSNGGTLNVTSGSFNLGATNPVNWTNGNTVSFNANATVSLGNDMSAPVLAVGNSGTAVATFTGSGTTLNVTSGVGVGNGNTGTLNFSSSASATTGGALNVSTTGIGQGNLYVQSGASLNHTGAITVGANAFNSASMTVNNASVIAGGGTLTVHSTGVLSIQNGGTFILNSGAINVSSGTAAQGKIVIGNGTGSPSSFTQTGAVGITLGLPSGSTATIQTNTGGTFITGTGGLYIDKSGLVDVAGGMFSLNSNATILGTLQRSAGGTFDWASSKTMSLQNGGDFLITGGYSLPASASITIQHAGSSLSQSGSGALTISNGSQLTIMTGATVTTLAARIADGANGTITQSGGTHSVGGGSFPVVPLILANTSGGTGTYNLSGGELTVTNDNAGIQAEAIGYLGVGNFVQTGGQHAVTGTNGNLMLGYGSNSVGTYTASNGDVVCGSLQIGYGGAGTMTLNSNGYAQVDTSIELGHFNGVTGTLNVNNSGGFASGASMYVGGSPSAQGGTGVVNINGGDIQISGETRIWNTTGSAINLSSGTFLTGTLNTSGNPSRFNWTGGTLRIVGTVFDSSTAATNLAVGTGKSLLVTNTTNIPAGASIAVNGGTFITGSLSGTGALSSDGNFIITGFDNASTTFTGPITGTGGLSKQGTGTLSVTNSRIDNLSVYGGAIAVTPSGGANTGTSVVGQLNIQLGCKLDLKDNKLIVTNGTLGGWNAGSYDGVTGMVQSGRLVTTMSNALPAIARTTLGVAVASQVSYGGARPFGGQSVNANDVLVMYTLAGDADFSGNVDGDDYFRIDIAYALRNNPDPPLGWLNGDFNYSGTIDADDYWLMDRNNGKNLASFGAGLPAGVTAVPEPCVGILGIGLLLRRRRRAV